MDPSRLAPVSWDRMERAVEQVRRRLERATTALSGAAIPHAIVGGNAVAAWVSRVDAAAVRNTRDVDILIRRADLDAAIQALRGAGFHHRHAGGVEVLLDGEGSSAREGIHLVFAAERVRPADLEPAPGITDVETAGPFPLVTLPALVRMKLVSFRDKDRMHLRDLVAVGLVGAEWLDRLPPTLAERLEQVLRSPDG